MNGPTFSGEQPPDLEAIRADIRRMTDEQLRKYGSAAQFMASPAAYGAGRKPREAFMVQLREARAEWRRRKAQDVPHTPPAVS